MGHANLCSPVTSIPPDGQSSRVRDCHDGDWLCLPRVCWTDSPWTDFRTISAKSEWTYGKRRIFPFFSFLVSQVITGRGAICQFLDLTNFVRCLKYLYELWILWKSSWTGRIFLFFFFFGRTDSYFQRGFVNCRFNGFWTTFETNIELNFFKQSSFFFRLVDAAV